MTRLKDSVQVVEDSPEILEILENDTDWLAWLASDVASGDCDAKLAKDKGFLAEIARSGNKYSTIYGHAPEFRDYAARHKFGSNNVEIVSKEYSSLTGNIQGAIEILESLGKDPHNVADYKFRMCSNNLSVKEALRFIDSFGVDRDLSPNGSDNLIWYKRGSLWAPIKNIDKPEAVIVYHDPLDLMGKGIPRTDEGAMSFYGLVMAELTLRDLIVDGGGVLILNPK
ncbi:MAG: hypothetical protein E6R05_00980 [Candidatus Moraniibacteriota bacterium]|nr:MAG: hypothetical protein E6R05_00980 [Candidatus Moranbacteria bacterium]